MGGEEESNVGKKIKIGVCVMEKKVKCGSEVLYYYIFYSIFNKNDSENQNPLTNLL